MADTEQQQTEQQTPTGDELPESFGLFAADDDAPAPEEKPDDSAEAKPEEKPSGDGSPAERGWADLLHRERELNRERDAIKAERDELGMTKAQLEEAAKLREQLETDPIAYLRSRGMSELEILQRITETDDEPEAQQGQPSKEVAALQEELAAVKKRLEERDQKEQQSRQQAELEAARTRETDTIAEEAKKIDDPLIAKMLEKSGGHFEATVLDRVLKHVQKTKQVLPYSQVIKAVADENRAEYRTAFDELLTIPEFRDYAISKLKEQQAAGRPQGEPQKAKTAETAPTLSEDWSGTVNRTERDLTDDEAEEEALRHLKRMFENSDE